MSASDFQALGAKELSAYRKQKNKELPSSGFKEYAPDGSWVQEKRIEKALEATREVVSEAKVNTRGSLVVGVWLPDESRVELVKGKGPFWRYMGYSEKRKDYLLPEEALFLMDSGTMVVTYGGVPLSIQQAYTRLRGDLTISEYQVYAHLMRQGYIVTRYTPGSETKVTRYEKKIGLDRHISKKQRKQQKKPGSKKTDTDTATRKRGIGSEHSVIASKWPKAGVCWESGDATVVVEGLHASDVVEESDQVFREDFYSKDSEVTNDSMETNTSPDLTCERKNSRVLNVSALCERIDKKEIIQSNQDICDTETGKTSMEDKRNEFTSPSLLVNDVQNSKEWSERLPYTDWDFTKFSFLSICDKDCSFQKPDSSLLPLNVDIEDSSFHVQRFSLPGTSKTKYHDGDVHELVFSCDSWNRTKLTQSSARNWFEYKQERLNAIKEDDDRQNTPIGYLWEDDVTPLLKPHDAKSTAHVLEKLQVIKSQPWDSNDKSTSDMPVDEFRLVFNLYSPDMKTQYRKSSPLAPNFRVSVLRQSTPPPDLAMITNAWNLTKDDVPILWAVTEFGSIQFYTFSPVEIPTDIDYK